MAPKNVAPIDIHIHFECFIEKPSLAPMRDMKNSDAKPRVMPNH